MENGHKPSGFEASLSQLRDSHGPEAGATMKLMSCWKSHLRRGGGIHEIAGYMPIRDEIPLTSLETFAFDASAALEKILRSERKPRGLLFHLYPSAFLEAIQSEAERQIDALPASSPYDFFPERDATEKEKKLHAAADAIGFELLRIEQKALRSLGKKNILEEIRTLLRACLGKISESGQ